jgi:predicted LPLAT superfamily acyltransferase
MNVTTANVSIRATHLCSFEYLKNLNRQSGLMEIKAVMSSETFLVENISVYNLLSKDRTVSIHP